MNPLLIRSPRFETRYLAFEQPAALAAQPRVLLRAEAVIVRALSVRRLQTLTPRGPRRPDASRPGITFGEMRASGVRDVLVYCRDYPMQPPHNDQRRPAGRIMSGCRTLTSGQVSAAPCGKRGADVRPAF